MHEIGHALGLYHEMSRLDRDNYITIHYSNIPHSLWKENFDKPLDTDSMETFHIPYDLGSLMHYGSEVGLCVL